MVSALTSLAHSKCSINTMKWVDDKQHRYSPGYFLSLHRELWVWLGFSTTETQPKSWRLEETMASLTWQGQMRPWMTGPWGSSWPGLPSTVTWPALPEGRLLPDRQGSETLFPIHLWELSLSRRPPPRQHRREGCYQGNHLYLCRQGALSWDQAKVPSCIRMQSSPAATRHTRPVTRGAPGLPLLQDTHRQQEISPTKQIAPLRAGLCDPAGVTFPPCRMVT